MSIRLKLMGAVIGIFLLVMTGIGLAFFITPANGVSSVDGRYLLRYVQITMCGVLLIAVITWLLTRFSTRTVRELSGFAERFHITDATMPEHLIQRRDEAGRLARAIDGMARRVSGMFHEKEYMAYHDSLTGLKNRYRLKEDVKALLARQEPFTFALMDIDDFKQINDCHGHAQGDRLLVDMAGVLLNVCDDSRIGIYRWGGDEFVLLMPGGCPCCEIFDDLRQRIEKNMPLRHSRKIGISMGVCPSSGGCETYGELLAAADSALDVAKKQGKNRCVSCDKIAASAGE